ncbi:GNAT family N-acetyltransferase [Telmatospirillum sp. J64-1]|uniref:GNAT family N-acetyltransferase n=1 Tax=Telmatospirillum sp. J64-1 TaxID=2502183 RepID=UPI0021076E59|nr:GNAT family N-acetyltransferase [Telmatospirillum sp. J64-1]
MTMKLVPAAPPFAALIAAMHRVCFKDYWDEKAVRDLLEMPGCYGWVAQDGQQPAGVILCRAAGGEAEVLTIAVLPPWRRHGIGGKLLDAALEAGAKAGAEVMFLEAAANNEAALSLYNTRKFEQVGRRARYYGGTIDALIMRRDL